MTRNHILVVGRPKSGKLRLLRDLTGSVPSVIPEDTHAGLSHELEINNAYYQATVGIWVDELSGSSEDWVAEFKSQEAREVRDVLGALVHTIDPQKLTKEELTTEITQLSSFTDVLDEEGWEGVKLLITRGPLIKHGNEDDFAAIEDLLLGAGIEHVDLLDKTVEYEGQRIGIDRVKEVIESYEWIDFPRPKDEDMNQGETEYQNGKKTNDDPVSAMLGTDQDVENFEHLVNRVMEAKATAQDMTDEDKEKLYNDITQLVDKLL